MDGTTVSQWAPVATLMVVAAGLWFRVRRFQTKDLEERVGNAAVRAAKKVVGDFHGPTGPCLDKFYPKDQGVILMTKMDGVQEDIKEMKTTLHEGLSRTHQRIDEILSVVKANGSRR